MCWLNCMPLDTILQVSFCGSSCQDIKRIVCFCRVRGGRVTENQQLRIRSAGLNDGERSRSDEKE